MSSGMSSGHGGLRAGAGRKRKAEGDTSQDEPGTHAGPGRPRKYVPSMGGVMSGTGVS